MKGAYVSGMANVVAMQVTPPIMAVRPSSQRQPWVSLRKPPAMGPRKEIDKNQQVYKGDDMPARKKDIHHLPRAGPRNGAVTNIPVASPRSALLNMSEMTPPVFVIDDEPNALAKNRRTSKAVMFGAHAAATLNAVYAMNEITKIDLRPYTSDRGAQINGPSANPNTKSDKPSVATSADTSKRCMTPWMPLAYTELAKATENVDRA